ncbi:MAG: hypothetical protein Q9225_000160 [Loekoesia sp. 1 TL-2023]
MSDLLQFILSHQDQFRRARLSSLFSDFTSQRHTNPDGYIVNVNIWKDVLYKAAGAGLILGRDGSPRRFSLEIGPQLLQKLESKEWGRPLALNAVIEAAGKAIKNLQGRSSQVDRILTKPMFGRDITVALGITGELSDSDLTILLKYLARDRRILEYDEIAVKIAGPDGVLFPISKEDRAIASLKSLMNDINEQIRSLEIQILALGKKSQRAVEMKNRSSALAALRSKRSAESALSKRTDALFQLEEVYGKIEQASDQVTMLGVMRDSTGVLCNLNAKAGSVQDVEDLLDDLKEEMGKADDIGTAINQAGQETSPTDEDEVDEELEALIRQSQSAEEEKAVEETKRRLANIDLADGLTHPFLRKPPLLSLCLSRKKLPFHTNVDIARVMKEVKWQQ